MVSLRPISFIQFCILTFIALATAQPSFLYHFCVYKNGNYTTNSIYETNLNRVLSSISSNKIIDNGFYSNSYGQEPDKAYGIGLCRGDVKPDVCRSCLNDSRISLKKLCPNQKEAIGWYDNCSLRFSNRSIFAVAESSPSFYMWNIRNVSDIDGYGQVLANQLDGMISETASGRSFIKFATRTAIAPDFGRIYVLSQCTTDLSEQDCLGCLRTISERIPLCCIGKAGGRIYTPSCNFRYETYTFFDQLTPAASPTSPSPPSQPVSPPPIKGTKRNTTTRTAIVIVVPTLVVIILVISIIYLFLRVKKRKDHFELTRDTNPQIKLDAITPCTYAFIWSKLINLSSMYQPAAGSFSEALDEMGNVESLQFDFEVIRAATDDFSDANKLGKGGFGLVYEGKLSNGQEIAVKRLSKNSGQGDLEFKNEVVLVAKLQHRNLVRLLGFCLEGNERLLVYEFVPNRSLDHYIFDPKKSANLDWERRYKIIKGIARGLLYLHEDSRLRIIHRDLKAANVLLDIEMNPKISDFGMARMCVLDQTEGSTNRIVGTYGYMAPEYAMLGQFSIKSDVFSFGVLMMEIISGQKITSFHEGENREYLLSYAWKNWREGTAANLIDLTLRSGPLSEMIRCIHIGLLCVQANVTDRLDMASVVLMLNSNSIALPLPTQPASFMQNEVPLATTMKLDTDCKPISQNEVSITELDPR